MTMWHAALGIIVVLMVVAGMVGFHAAATLIGDIFEACDPD